MYFCLLRKKSFARSMNKKILLLVNWRIMFKLVAKYRTLCGLLRFQGLCLLATLIVLIKIKSQEKIKIKFWMERSGGENGQLCWYFDCILSSFFFNFHLSTQIKIFYKGLHIPLKLLSLRASSLLSFFQNIT